jgi:hypothetical protein
MFESFENMFGRKPAKKKGSTAIGTSSTTLGQPCEERDRRQTFAKVFRWQAPAGQTTAPTTVDVIGSFTDWHKVPLVYDKVVNGWHVTLNKIIGNRTHHYVILVDGKPTYDETCDGLATPQNEQEERWHIDSPKGPRVMMLFGQTK